MKNWVSEKSYTGDLNLKVIERVGSPYTFAIPDFRKENLGKKIEPIKGKTILVVRMLDIAKIYSKNNRVIYLTDDILMANEFEKSCVSCDNENDVDLIYDWDNFIEYMENDKMPKFDVVIMNPPYEVNNTTKPIHLVITKSMVEKYSDVVCVMPNVWYRSYGDRHKDNKVFFSDKTKSIENIDNTNEIFGTSMADVSIFHFSKGYNFDYDTLKDNPFVGIDKEIYDFLNKKSKGMLGQDGLFDKKNLKFIRSTILNVKIKNKFVTFVSYANGSMNGKWISNKRKDTIIKSDDIFDFYKDKKNQGRRRLLLWETKIEAENFNKAIQLPILRFGLHKLQTDQNMPSLVWSAFPSKLDWSNPLVTTNEGILELCGCPKSKIKQYVKYVKDYMKKVDNGK